MASERHFLKFKSVFNQSGAVFARIFQTVLVTHSNVSMFTSLFFDLNLPENKTGQNFFGIYSVYSKNDHT